MCRTKNGALRNSHINWIFLWRLSIHNHLKPSTTQKRTQIRPNIWSQIPQDVSLWRRPACHTMSKALDKLSATAQVAPDLLKALAILLDTTVRRSAVDQEDLKLYWKSEKKPFFKVIKNPIIHIFFKDFTNHRPFPNILKYRGHWCNLPTISKTRLLKTLIEEFS